MSINKNLGAFEEALPSLLESGNLGKYANGRKGEKFECFNTYEDAIRSGYERFGARSFIVRRINYLEIPLMFARDLVLV